LPVCAAKGIVIMEPIYLPHRQYDALVRLCSLGPVGEWINRPNARVRSATGISKSHMAKLCTLLAEAGVIEVKRISNRGDRAARVIIPHDDPRIVPVKSILHTPEAVAKMSDKATIRAEAENRPRPRQLIKYAGWEPGARW